MGVITGTVIAASIAAAATTTASVYSANKQSNAARDAADTQSKSAEKSAQLQTDSANRSAEIQAQSAREALDYSRGQSQLSLDQYNQQQTRLQPYRNLGNFALGLPNEAAPAPMQLPGLPGQSGQPAPQSPQAADPATMTKQIQESFQRLFGREATADEVQQGLHYGSKPDLYSDGKWRIGFNDYLATRIGNGSESADPSLAGTSGIIAAPTGGAAGGSAPAARQPVTLGYKPAATPFVTRAPLTAALQTPQLRYRPLGSIGVE